MDKLVGSICFLSDSENRKRVRDEERLAVRQRLIKAESVWRMKDC